MSFALAFTAALCYFIGSSRIGPDTYYSLGSGCFIGMVCGLVYGDVATGLIIGASICLMYLGFASPGANIPADEPLACSVAIPLALQAGMTTGMAVSLAVPFAMLGVLLNQLRRTINIYFIHKADEYAEKGDEKGIFRCGFWYPVATAVVLRFIPVFVLLYFGSDMVSQLVELLPAWLTHGLSVTGNMLPALGFAVVMKFSGSKALLPYFFIGFFAVQYLGLNMIACAIFGACIALIAFFNKSKEEGTANV